jgi:hypothetical protein
VTGTSLRIVEDGVSVRASQAFDFSPSTDYQIVLTLNGNSISVTAGGVTASYSSSVRATATKHGVLGYNIDSGDYSKIYDISVVSL